MRAFKRYQMVPQGVACITATKGKKRKDGGHMFDEEYCESKRKMRFLLKTHCLQTPWHVPPVKWFSTILQSILVAKLFAYFGIPKSGPGIRKLIQRCEMTEDEAIALGEVLSEV